MGPDDRRADARAPWALAPQVEVQRALRAEEFRLHYQPVVHLGTGRVQGFEALLRWQHPDGGLLTPDDFLPAVSNAPVMREITRWVLQEACAAVRQWPTCGISVNVTAIDVVHETLLTDVDEALRRNNLQPERLTIELTEHAVVQNLDAAARVLTRLQQAGVGIALDDFGTGYSSLFYLRQLPITEIKIDGFFVSRVTTSNEDAAIVRSVAALARGVRARVVAEGVETIAQAAFVRDAGCTAAQGFLWSRPKPAADVDLDQVPVLRRLDARARAKRPARTRTPEAVMSRIQQMLADSASLRTIAAALNREGSTTPQGRRWTPATVALALDTPNTTGGPGRPTAPNG